MRLQEAVRRLVLSRKEGTSIDVAGIMRITVKRVQGSQVSLVFEAPEDIKIKRSELADRDDQNKAA